MKIADVLFAAASSSTDFRENLLRTYRDLQSAEPRRVQDQFVELLSERSTYGMIQLEMKTRSNESICLGLNPQGIFSRSFLQTEFQREVYWHQIQSIVSAKHRQISVNCKPTRTLNFAPNRSGARLLRLFWENFRSTSASKIEIPICVPDFRSDGESSSNDCTPSSTRSSSQPSETLWSGSLPNLTKSNATLDDDDDETPKKTVSSRRSLPGSQVRRSLLRVGLSCSLLSLNSRPSKKKTTLSPCLSCDCLVDEVSRRFTHCCMAHSLSHASTFLVPDSFVHSFFSRSPKAEPFAHFSPPRRSRSKQTRSACTTTRRRTFG